MEVGGWKLEVGGWRLEVEPYYWKTSNFQLPTSNIHQGLLIFIILRCHMHPTNCLNCATLLTADDRFCPTCGQKSSTHKITMPHIWHDIFHAFTHADKGFLYVFRELLYRPGHVAREYVDGMRKKYFNPFSYLFIIVAVATLLSSTFNLMADPSRRDPISLFLNKHANVVMLVHVPISAFFSWLFFIRSKRSYAESLVLFTYTGGERSAIYSLLVVPVMVALPQYYLTIVWTFHIAFFLYFGWACAQFFRQQNVWGYIRGIAVAFLTLMVIYALISAAYYVYYRYINVPPPR